MEFKTIPADQDFPKEMGTVRETANFWIQNQETFWHRKHYYYISTTLEPEEDLPLPMITKYLKLNNNRMSHPQRKVIKKMVGIESNNPGLFTLLNVQEKNAVSVLMDPNVTRNADWVSFEPMDEEYITAIRPSAMEKIIEMASDSIMRYEKLDIYTMS